jgi:small subunit ribosomal protein S20
MPNTKSAEKRVRSNARKATRNQSVKSSVKTFEKKFLELATAGKLDEAKAALSVVTSAYARAAKGGVLKRETASRKASRLQLHLNRVTTAQAVAPQAAAPKVAAPQAVAPKATGSKASKA